MAVLYFGFDRIERIPTGNTSLLVYEALFTVLEALLIGALLEGPLAGYAPGDPPAALIAAVLASGLGMGLYVVLPSSGTVWGAFPGFSAKSIAAQACAVVCWYAPTYVMTLLIAATVAALHQRRGILSRSTKNFTAETQRTRQHTEERQDLAAPEAHSMFLPGAPACSL